MRNYIGLRIKSRHPRLLVQTISTHYTEVEYESFSRHWRIGPRLLQIKNLIR